MNGLPLRWLLIPGWGWSSGDIAPPWHLTAHPQMQGAPNKDQRKWSSWKLWLKMQLIGISLAVQWLRLHTATAEGLSSIAQGTKILHDARNSKKKKKSN